MRSSQSKIFDIKGFEEDIYKHFERVNAVIKGDSEKSKKLAERFESEIKDIRNNLDEVRGLLTDIQNTKNMARDLEILKTKIGWIETEIEKLSKRDEKVSELESKVGVMKAVSPVIIE